MEIGTGKICGWTGNKQEKHREEHTHISDRTFEVSIINRVPTARDVSFQILFIYLFIYFFFLGGGGGRSMPRLTYKFSDFKALLHYALFHWRFHFTSRFSFYLAFLVAFLVAFLIPTCWYPKRE